jgi:hypothetical protein
MAKEYNIFTMQDVLDCVTEENKERFLKDFDAYLTSAINMRNIGLSICDIEHLPKDMAYVKTEGFTWIDDGKHNCSIKITISNDL